jgi:hypothetical protein
MQYVVAVMCCTAYNQFFPNLVERQNIIYCLKGHKQTKKKWHSIGVLHYMSSHFSHFWPSIEQICWLSHCVCQVSHSL